MIAVPDTTSTEPGKVATLLSAQYGLAAFALARLDMGQGTVNYRATVPGHDDVFVKCYPPGNEPGRRAGGHHPDPPGSPPRRPRRPGDPGSRRAGHRR
jgi:hypothetical protein